MGNNEDKKRVLVTGGAGFLGSHLCDRLLKDGNYVICLDNFYTGHSINIEHMINNNNFKLLKHDIINPIKINVDEIYNLACPASPIHYQHDPIFTLKTSIFGTVNMAEIAIKLNAKILHASTSEIYGDPEIHPQIEEYWGNVNPIGLRACYDEGKRCAETLLFDYKRQNNLRLKVARIFNTYGPRMHPKDGRVISTFIIQALNNETITVYGDGMQTRSFCYVDDMVEGLVKLMNSNFQGPVNLGNDKEMTIKNVANTILKQINSNSKIVFEDIPVDDPLKRKPDISLAKKLLDFNPNISFSVGLEKTIVYFRKVTNG